MPTHLKHKCIDCDNIVILKKSLRCKPCANRFISKNRIINYQCLDCGTKISNRARRCQPCAHKNRSKNFRLNPNWQEKDERKSIRASKEYSNWRYSVYKRDKYSCKKCGTTTGKMHAHHIKTFAEFEELRLDIENGITLCIPCHKKEHKSMNFKYGEYV